MTRPDFVFGNTRLRARFPALMDRADLDALVGRAPAVVLDALPGARLERDGGESAAQVAVQAWLRSQLRDLGTVYSGAAADMVQILLARHDLTDTIALLRGARAGADAQERLGAVLAVGAIDQDAARDVAGAADGAAAVNRLVARHLPDPTTAAVLPQAWQRFTVNDDPIELETTIADTAIERWMQVLDEGGSGTAPIRDLIAAETDQRNLIVALGSPTGHPPGFLPAGRIPTAHLTGTRIEALAAAGAAYPSWRAALDQYAAEGRRATLATEIDAVIWRRAMAGLRSGDPLDASVPVAYVIAVECQAHALRWLVQSARRELDPRPVLVTR